MSFQKTISIITLISFVFTNASYGAPGSRSLFKNKKVDYQKLSAQKEETLQRTKSVLRGEDINKSISQKKEAQRLLSAHLEDISQIHIPSEIGRITEVYQNPDTKVNDKLIVHIQDLHTNPEGELNLAKILEILLNDYKLTLICSEGADGKVDTSSVSSFPDKTVREKVAKIFVNSGELTGEEYLSITKYPDLPIWGIEDRDIYFENIIQFNRIMKFNPGSQIFISQTKKALEELKPKIYSKELLSLDQKESEYDSQKIETVDYIKYLSDYIAKLNIPISNYKNITLLQETMDSEKKIDQEKIMIDSQNLLLNLQTAIQAKSSIKDMDSLMAKAQLFKEQKISPFSFYSYLKDLALKHGVIARSEVYPVPLWYGATKQSNYSNLIDFIDYLTKVNALDSTKLFIELGDLNFEIKLSLSKTDEQKSLTKALRNISFLEGFFSLKISNEELDYYLNNKDSHKVGWFKSVITDITGKTGLTGKTDYIDFNPDLIDSHFQELESFYKIVKQRDIKMASNAISEIEKRNSRVNALVAGGFHTKGITRILKEKGYSYIVISPYSSTEIDEENYHFLLSGRRKPVEELIKELNATLRVPIACDADMIEGINKEVAPVLEDVTLASISERATPIYIAGMGEILKGWDAVYKRMTDEEFDDWFSERLQDLRRMREEGLETGSLMDWLRGKRDERNKKLFGQGEGSYVAEDIAKATIVRKGNKDVSLPIEGRDKPTPLTHNIIDTLEREGWTGKIELKGLFERHPVYGPITSLSRLRNWIDEHGESAVNVALSVDKLTLNVYPTPRIGGKAPGQLGRSRRDFLKTTALTVAGVSLNVVSPTRLLPQGDMSLQQKLEAAKEGIANYQGILNEAMGRGIMVDITKLTCTKRDGSIDEGLTKRLKEAFGILGQVKDLFVDKDALKALIGSINEENAYAAIGVILKFDSPVLRDMLSVIGAEETTIGNVAREILDVIKQVIDGVMIAPEKEIPLRKPAIGEFGEDVTEIVNWFLDEHNRSAFKIGKSLRILPGFENQVDQKAPDDHMRQIIAEAFSGYDEAGVLMLFLLTGNVDIVKNFFNIMDRGSMGQLKDILSYWVRNNPEHPFNFNPPDPSVVINVKGKRGGPFRLLSAFGNYYIRLLDGRIVTWSQWQPIAGEVAWVVMAACQLHNMLHNGQYLSNETEIRVAEEFARAYLFLLKNHPLEGDKGILTMGPGGIWSDHETGNDPFQFWWLFDEGSFENAISWVGALDMLAEITGKQEYKDAAEKIRGSLKWAFDKDRKMFVQGAHYDKTTGQWTKNVVPGTNEPAFATDVQLWAILKLGADWIDQEFGEGMAFEMLKNVIDRAGVRNDKGELNGLDYTDSKMINKEPKRSGEWTEFGIFTLQFAAKYYKDKAPDKYNILMSWARELDNNTQDLNVKLAEDKRGILYAGKKDGGSIENFEEIGIPRVFSWLAIPRCLHVAASFWKAMRKLTKDEKQGANPFALGFALGEIEPITRVEERPRPDQSKSEFAELRQNWPNPFGDTGTNITYTIYKPANNAKIQIFNIKGELVKVFDNLEHGIGSHTFHWGDLTNEQGKHIAADTYFIRLIVTDTNGEDYRHTIGAKYIPGFELGMGFLIRELLNNKNLSRVEL